MSPDDPAIISRTMESLKQAMAMLEASAARQATPAGEFLSPGDLQALALGRAMVVLRDALRRETQARPEVRESLEFVAAFINQGLGTMPGVAEPVVSHPSGIPQDDFPPDASSVPTPDAGPLQAVPLMIAGTETLIHVAGTAAEATAAREAALRARNEGWSATPGASISAPSPVDMPLIAVRCRIKAEGCDWAAQFRDAWEPETDDGGLRRARYHDIIARARAQPNCYVWALNPSLKIPPQRPCCGSRRAIAISPRPLNLPSHCKARGRAPAVGSRKATSCWRMRNRRCARAWTSRACTSTPIRTKRFAGSATALRKTACW